MFRGLARSHNVLPNLLKRPLFAPQKLWPRQMSFIVEDKERAAEAM